MIRGKIITAFWILLLVSGCQAAGQPAPSPTPLAASSKTVASPTVAVSPSSGEPVTAAVLLPTSTAQQTPTPRPSLSPATAAESCASVPGRVENTTVTANPYGPLPVLVYLPPCYTANAAQAYPALYLLHGANADNTQWVDLGVPVTADRLIQSGQVPAFLVVMPEEQNDLQNPNESAYGDWVLHSLVPWVDQQYRTCAQQTCRAIGGLSRGGSWAFRIGLAGWQIFSAIGMDSAVPFDGDLRNLQTSLLRIPTGQKPRFYLDIGKDDGAVEPAFQAAEALTRLRVTIEWHLSAGAHNRAYWRAHVEEYLRWYAKAWEGHTP